MIKLLSFFIFTTALIWSWTLFHSKNSISVDIHAGIQSKLAILIEETIKRNKPNSTHFEILNISTEKLDDNKISAQFTYRYDDQLEDKEMTNQTMSGEAILNRGLSENPQVQKWIVQSVKSSASSLEFKEGLVISSDGKESLKTAPLGAPPAENKTE